MKYFDNKSFVQKTIKADSPLYRSHMRQKPSSEEMKKRYQLYNMLLRDPQAIFTVYHGTSQDIYKKILNDGGFSSPKARKKEHLEQRTRGHEEVFVTTSVEKADYYQRRTTDQQNQNRTREQEKDKPIIIEMRIPIVWLQDVSSVILKTTETQHIYTEYEGPRDIEKLLDFNNKSVEQIADDIKNYFKNEVEQMIQNEFTIRHFVPKRFIKGTSLDSINLWKRWVAENTDKYEEAIKIFPKNKEQFYETYKQVWIQRVKKEPGYLYHDAIELFPNDKDIYEAGKQGYLQLVKLYPNNYWKIAIKLFPNDKEEFYEAGKQGWLHLVKNDPKYYYEKAIKLFPNDKDIYEAGKQGYLQLVKNNPFSYHNAIKLFPNDKDIYEAGKQVYLQLVKNDPSYYDDAIKLFPNDKDEFYEAAKQGYLQAVARNPVFNYEEAIQLFPEAKHEFDIAAGKIPQEQPKQACGWYRRIKY